MINDKQFLLSKQVYCKDGWLSERLCSGFVLSWQEKLHVYISSDKQLAVLGEVWQVDSERESPYHEIEKAISLSDSSLSKEKIIEIENTWCGRYVIISSEFVFLDASGLLGVFYTKNNCSSSLNVLSEVEDISLIDSKIEYGLMPNFIPGPFLPTKDVRRLLPCQIFNYSESKALIRKMLPDGSIECHDIEKQCKEYIRYSDVSLSNMSKLFENRKLALALTGGRDSRLTMALLQHAGVDFVTYTFGHSNLSDGDRILPRQLSECLHKNNYFYEEDSFSYNKSLERDYDTQVSGLVKDRDRIFYANGLYQKLKNDLHSDIVLLRSSAYAGIYEYYSKLCPKGKLDVNVLFPMCKYNKYFKASISEYDSILESDYLNMGISDWNRYYWELRIGCWMSAIELGFDMMDGVTSIHPMNSRKLLSLLVGFDLPVRKGNKKHEEYLTKYACPELAAFPYDYKLERKKSSNVLQKVNLLLHISSLVCSKYGLFCSIDYLASSFINKMVR